MKTDTHQHMARPVLFVDAGTGDKFLIESTVATTDTDTYEGTEYPVCKVEISSASHPFYTGTEKVMDTAGRVDKFKRRMEAASAKPSKKVTEKVARKVEEVAEDTKDTAEEVVDTVSEKVSDAVEAVTDAVSSDTDEEKKD